MLFDKRIQWFATKRKDSSLLFAFVDILKYSGSIVWLLYLRFDWREKEKLIKPINCCQFSIIRRLVEMFAQMFVLCKRRLSVLKSVSILRIIALDFGLEFHWFNRWKQLRRQTRSECISEDSAVTEVCDRKAVKNAINEEMETISYIINHIIITANDKTCCSSVICSLGLEPIESHHKSSH